MDEIKFLCEVVRVQTLRDGGIRVTLDLAESAIMEMAQLAECQRQGMVLEITAKANE